jgi:hypothetical protein
MHQYISNRRFSFTSKPSTWSEVEDCIHEAALDRDFLDSVATYTDVELDIKSPLDYYAGARGHEIQRRADRTRREPSRVVVLIVKVESTGKRYLVNNEGYGYSRYVAKLPEQHVGS